MAGKTPPTPAEIVQITARIRMGIAPVRAAAAVGFDPDEFVRWMDIGRRGGRGNTVYMDLYQAVIESEAESEVELIGRIRSAAADGAWQAAAWIAERRFGDRWNRKSVSAAAGSSAPKAPSDEDEDAPFSGLDNVESINRNRRSS